MATKENEVIFAGLDEPQTHPKGECEFGIYVQVEKDRAVWLPAITADQGVADQLKGMSLGQSFKIVSSEDEGGLGTRIHAIETDRNATVYHVPLSVPPTLKL